MRFRRRLYRRGSSVETTIPKPLLFALDERDRHDVLFEYDAERDRWYLRFAPREEGSHRGPHRTRAAPTTSTKGASGGDADA